LARKSLKISIFDKHLTFRHLHQNGCSVGRVKKHYCAVCDAKTIGLGTESGAPAP
jgi:hypothetical protein